MKKYIGCKIIKAQEMDEHTFINKVKNQDVPRNQENRPGYMVCYPDGYTSWSPKEVFETSYREITIEEEILIVSSVMEEHSQVKPITDEVQQGFGIFDEENTNITNDITDDCNCGECNCNN